MGRRGKRRKQPLHGFKNSLIWKT